MPIPATPIPQGRKLLRDVVFQQISQAIIEGQLEAGERLNDQELADWLGVSRTPVREALTMLETVGLVELTPGMPARVTKIDDKRLFDVIAVLAALHMTAMDLAFDRLREVDLEAMRVANDTFKAARASGRTGAALTALDHFHGLYLRLAGNKVVLDVTQRILPVLKRTEFAHSGSVIEDSMCVLNRAIIVAVADGNRVEALKTVRKIWASALKEIGRSDYTLPE